MELVPLVGNSVAGEVDQNHIVRAAVGEQIAQCLLDPVPRLVLQYDHFVEAADLRAFQNAAQAASILRGRTHPPEMRILIVRGRYDKGVAAHRYPRVTVPG